MPSPETALVGGLLSGSALTLLGLWMAGAFDRTSKPITTRRRT